jgi:membrane fusion protein (multidrug efflux system)
MSVQFVRTARSLEADSSSGWLLSLVVAAALLGVWGLWFGLARVTVYRTSDQARLETVSHVHPMDAAVAGQIVETSLELERPVHVGEMLVELDSKSQRLELDEQRARIAALAPQLTRLRSEIAAEEKALTDGREAGRWSLEQTHARNLRTAKVAAIASDIAGRYRALIQARVGAEVQYLRALSEAQQAQAAADAARLEINRLQKDLQSQEGDRLAHIAELNRQASEVEGERDVARAAIARLMHDIEIRYLLAPIDGQIGAIAPDIRVGAFVAEGQRLCAIVPPKQAIAVAEFAPWAALGLIRPGQPARLRLRGFPWAQYGSIPARVTEVASEPRAGQIRVEFSVEPAAAPLIPFQNGLPGTIEVAVERASPALLVLRAAGQLMAKPGKASTN